jgi:hypothetical protein
MQRLYGVLSRGLGPCPSPNLCQMYRHISLYITFKHYIPSTTVDGLVARPYQNVPTQTKGHGFDSRRTHTILPNQSANKGVPCGSLCLGHMAPYHLPTSYCVFDYDSSICLLHVYLVNIHCTCHVSYGCTTLPRQSVPRVTLTVVPCVTLLLVHLSPSTTQTVPMHHCHITCMVVRAVQSAATSTLYRLHSHQFLYVWQNEQIAISFAYDVHLSPFKLCWVHIEEAYAHVRFEEILSTSIFRPSWTPS